MIKILLLGEIIGLPTVREIKNKLSNIKEKYEIDLIIANADGASDGYGILRKTAIDLHKSGIDIITTGDFVFNKKDVRELLKLDFVVRPFNVPPVMGGSGICTLQHNNKNISIINILGRLNFSKIYAADPFYAVSKAIDKINEQSDIIIVDFHGGATSEIQVMQWYLAGKATLVAGSHLRVLTSDNRIINDRTAIITGIGFCGGLNSVCGLEPDIEIKKIRNGQFYFSKVVAEEINLQGIIIDIDEENGNALKTELLNEVI